MKPIEPDPAGGEVARLLARVVAGDRDAAGELVSLHDERLRRIVRARLDPRMAQRLDPDDVLQDVHAEALTRLPAYAEARTMPFFLWMRYLAVQRCAGLARQHLLAASRDARRETPPWDSSVTSTDLFATHLAASATSPSASAARHEVHLRLRAAIDALDPTDRDVVWLRHFEALDNGEVADVLAIEPPAASKRYVRAIGRLRDLLGDMPGLGGLSW